MTHPGMQANVAGGFQLLFVLLQAIIPELDLPGNSHAQALVAVTPVSLGNTPHEQGFPSFLPKLATTPFFYRCFLVRSSKFTIQLVRALNCLKFSGKKNNQPALESHTRS